MDFLSLPKTREALVNINKVQKHHLIMRSIVHLILLSLFLQGMLVFAATPRLSIPRCNLPASYFPGQGTYSIKPFPAYTADYRSRSPGTYYVAYASLPSYVDAADLGWDGIKGTRDDGPMNIRLANTLSREINIHPVASDKRILYNFADTAPYGDPLILYHLGDGLLANGDDRIFVLVPHHVIGSDTKDIAREAMMYMIARNGPPIVIYHHLGPDGIPSADDYAAPLTHYSFSVNPVEVKVSFTGKFAMRFANGNAQIYDLGADMRYAAGANDDVVYALSNMIVSAIDMSPDGRYTAYAYTRPGDPTYYLDIYDVGPNSRLESLLGDDTVFTISSQYPIAEPRIDGVDNNVQATARMVYLSTTSTGQQIEYINAGQDARFDANDQKLTFYQHQGSPQISSLRIAGSLITFEDNINIYFYSLCA